MAPYKYSQQEVSSSPERNTEAVDLAFGRESWPLRSHLGWPPRATPRTRERRSDSFKDMQSFAKLRSIPISHPHEWRECLSGDSYSFPVKNSRPLRKQAFARPPARPAYLYFSISKKLVKYSFPQKKSASTLLYKSWRFALLLCLLNKAAESSVLSQHFFLGCSKVVTVHYSKENRHCSLDLGKQGKVSLNT